MAKIYTERIPKGTSVFLEEIAEKREDQNTVDDVQLYNWHFYVIVRGSAKLDCTIRTSSDNQYDYLECHADLGFPAFLSLLFGSLFGVPSFFVKGPTFAIVLFLATTIFLGLWLFLTYSRGAKRSTEYLAQRILYSAQMHNNA